MVVGAAGYQTEAFIGQRFGKCLCVVDDLLLVCFKFRLDAPSPEANCFGSDDMLQWTALCAREYSLVDLFCQSFLAQDQTASWTAQGLWVVVVTTSAYRTGF